MAEPKIVFFDIETIPDMTEALKVWCGLSNYYGLTMKGTITSLLCVGWKELGKKKVHCINAWDYPEKWAKDINDDSEVCKAIYEVLKEADAVVTHNGVRFDWKHLQTRFLINGLPPLPKVPHIDTCLVARSNLLSFNNKLGYLGDWLVGDTKLENGGWQLWVDVSKRIKKAQNLMSKYCKQDVALLEKVFLKLRPFIKNLPNNNLYRSAKKIINAEYVCTTCSSPDIRKHGFYHTKTKSYQRLFCNNCKSTGKYDINNRNPRTL